ncbi:MAG: formylglycine-generating enzyme family protein, partial [Gammaproteobacteria bacterium]
MASILILLLIFNIEAHESENLVVDCMNCPQLIKVSSGSFIKGSPKGVEGSRDDERPQHEVNIGYAFYAAQYEVKRIEYEQFINDTGYDMSGGCYGATEEGIVLGEDLSWFDPGYQVSDDHPVVCVSWNDAKAYVEWLSRKTGFKYRLFSESEWEYIARAGTSTIRFWGDADEGCEYANGADLDITPEAFLEEMKGRQSKIVLPDD